MSVAHPDVILRSAKATVTPMPGAVPEPAALIARLEQLAGDGGPPEETLEAALRSVVEEMGAAAGALCLYDGRQDVLRLAAEVGLSDEGCRQLRSVRANGSGGWEIPLLGLRNRRAYLIDKATESRYVPPLLEPAASMRTVACVPLYAGPNPLGTLVLVTSGARVFAERDVHALERPLRLLGALIEAVRRRSGAERPAGAPEPPREPEGGDRVQLLIASLAATERERARLAAALDAAADERAEQLRREGAIEARLAERGLELERVRTRLGEVEAALVAEVERREAAERTVAAERAGRDGAERERLEALEAEIASLRTAGAAAAEALDTERNARVAAETARETERDARVAAETDLGTARDEAAARERELRALEARRAAAEAEVAELRGRHAAAEAAVVEVGAARTAVERELAALRERQAAAEAEITALRDERARAATVLAERRAAADAEIDDLRERCAAAGAALDDLRHERAALEAEVAGLRARLANAGARPAVDAAAPEAVADPPDAATHALGAATPTAEANEPDAATAAGAAVRADGSAALVILDAVPGWEVAGGRVQILAPGPDVARAVARAAGATVLANVARPQVLPTLVALRAAGSTGEVRACLADGNDVVPLGLVEAVPAGVDAEQLLAALGRVATRGSRIITAGGDVDVLMSVRRTLGTRGMSVSMAWDAHQAADLLVMMTPDVAVVDLGLSARDAAAILGRLVAAERVPHLVVILGDGDGAAPFASALASPGVRGRVVSRAEALRAAGG